MWYKNIASRFFGLVTKHACDGRTDRRMDRIRTPKTAIAQLRCTVKTNLCMDVLPTTVVMAIFVILLPIVAKI